MNDTLRQWKRDTFWYVIGFVTGAGVMIWINSQVVQTKADETRHLQRVKELRFSLEKLERAKAVQDAFLKQAVVNRDDIRERVAKLGEGK